MKILHVYVLKTNLYRHSHTIALTCNWPIYESVWIVMNLMWQESALHFLIGEHSVATTTTSPLPTANVSSHLSSNSWCGYFYMQKCHVPISSPFADCSVTSAPLNDMHRDLKNRKLRPKIPTDELFPVVLSWLPCASVHRLDAELAVTAW